MNRIERRSTNELHSLVECKTLVDIIAQTLQVAECGVALVTVIDILLDAKLLQQQHTTDTKQNLLLQTVLPVTTIESVGNGFVELRVHIIVCIKQIQLHTAYIYTPYISVNLIVVVRYVDHQRITILVKLTLDRQRTEVLCLIVGNLLSVHRQALSEIAETIEETNGTHIDIRVRSLLHIVTSQHTQTTRVDLQGRVHTVLHTEVGNRGALCIGLHVHIFTELPIDILDALHQSLILYDSLLALKAETLQQHHGIMSHFVIDFNIELTEQVACLVVPHPPHIVGNLVQTLQFLRKGSFDGQNLPRGIVCVICFNFHNVSNNYFEFSDLSSFRDFLRASALLRAMS